MSRGNGRYDQVGAFETIAIRLGIWTGPTDVEVPPMPWGRIAVTGGVALVGAIVLVVALLGQKDRNDERDRKTSAAEHRRIRARVAAEQTPHRARLGPPLTDAASPLAWENGLDRVVGALEAKITADAQARYRRRELSAPVSRTDCEPFVRPRRANPPDPPVGARYGRYECLAISRDLSATSRTEAARAGFPFWARVDFVRGRVVWCKVRPAPAEGAIGGSIEVPLARECDLRRT